MPPLAAGGAPPAASAGSGERRRIFVRRQAWDSARARFVAWLPDGLTALMGFHPFDALAQGASAPK
eukprot:15483455-Alexandrium_andersonii.AAC.1